MARRHHPTTSPQLAVVGTPIASAGPGNLQVQWVFTTTNPYQWFIFLNGNNSPGAHVAVVTGSARNTSALAALGFYQVQGFASDGVTSTTNISNVVTVSTATAPTLSAGPGSGAVHWSVTTPAPAWWFVFEDGDTTPGDQVDQVNGSATGDPDLNTGDNVLIQGFAVDQLTPLTPLSNVVTVP